MATMGAKTISICVKFQSIPISRGESSKKRRCGRDDSQLGHLPIADPKCYLSVMNGALVLRLIPFKVFWDHEGRQLYRAYVR